MVRICETEECKKKPQGNRKYCATCIKKRNAVSRLKSYHRNKKKKYERTWRDPQDEEGLYFTKERRKQLTAQGYQLPTGNGYE